MNSLIERARTFATSAHQRIGHQRKYNNQPYDVHLQAVAKLVAGVTDDPEMIAAAWLHDTLEYAFGNYSSAVGVVLRNQRLFS